MPDADGFGDFRGQSLCIAYLLAGFEEHPELGQCLLNHVLCISGAARRFYEVPRHTDQFPALRGQYMFDFSLCHFSCNLHISSTKCEKVNAKNDFS